jgi:amino acid transporter
MFDALSGMFCFVTATVSFLYGTRIAWVCGKRCHFKEEPHTRKQLLSESIPAASAVYFFGFVIVFSLFLDGFLTVFIPSITSAILLAHLVVTMAMPVLKRKPGNK